MKKIVCFILCLFCFVSPITGDAAVYWGAASLTLTAPEGFDQAVKVNMMSTDFADVVENETRVMSDEFVFTAEGGYTKYFDKLKGGKWMVTLSWEDPKAEKDWTIEKFAYQFEIGEGENKWEIPITVAQKEEVGDEPRQSFLAMIWDLVKSVWDSSGPVIIVLILIGLYYVYYKYKNFDKYDKK